MEHEIGAENKNPRIPKDAEQSGWLAPAGSPRPQIAKAAMGLPNCPFVKLN